MGSVTTQNDIEGGEYNDEVYMQMLMNFRDENYEQWRTFLKEQGLFEAFQLYCESDFSENHCKGE